MAHTPSSPYNPLSDGEVRLIRVARSSVTDDIECQSRKFELGNCPEYTALSYACGSRPANFRIKLNGRVWFVRKNLWRFLRQHVSLQTEATALEWFWIDAICINQSDDYERTHQVRLMAKIYRQASRALIWLGPAYEQSDLAMKELAKKPSEQRRLERASWSLAMSGLCARTYWRRLWVLQELHLSRDKRILCGTRTVPWDLFESFMFSVQNSTQSVLLRDHTGYIYNSPAMQMIQLSQKLSDDVMLWELLSTAAFLQCEEQKDRAYALLGIVRNGIGSLDPDYSISLPVLLNKLLKRHHQHSPPDSLDTVASQCSKLEEIFDVGEGEIFALEETISGLHERGRSRDSTITYGNDQLANTMLWAAHYQHDIVRDLLLDYPITHALSFKLFCALFASLPFIALTVVVELTIPLYLIAPAFTPFLWIMYMLSVIWIAFRLRRNQPWIRRMPTPVRIALREASRQAFRLDQSLVRVLQWRVWQRLAKNPTYNRMQAYVATFGGYDNPTFPRPVIIAQEEQRSFS